MKKKSRERKVKFTEVSKETKQKIILSILIIVIGVLISIVFTDALFIGGFMVGFGVVILFLHSERYHSDEIVYKVKV